MAGELLQRHSSGHSWSSDRRSAPKQRFQRGCNRSKRPTRFRVSGLVLETPRHIFSWRRTTVEESRFRSGDHNRIKESHFCTKPATTSHLRTAEPRCHSLFIAKIFQITFIVLLMGISIKTNSFTVPAASAT